MGRAEASTNTSHSTCGAVEGQHRAATVVHRACPPQLEPRARRPRNKSNTVIQKVQTQMRQRRQGHAHTAANNTQRNCQRGKCQPTVPHPNEEHGGAAEAKAQHDFSPIHHKLGGFASGDGGAEGGRGSEGTGSTPVWYGSRLDPHPHGISVRLCRRSNFGDATPYPHSGCESGLPSAVDTKTSFSGPS